MTITLNGIALGIGNDLVLRGLRAPMIQTSVERSDDGVAQIYIAPMEGGRELTMHGTITYAEHQEVMNIIAAALPVPLVHPQFSGNVLVIATDFSDPLTELIDPDDDSWLEGTFTMIEV